MRPWRSTRLERQCRMLTCFDTLSLSLFISGSTARHGTSQHATVQHATVPVSTLQYKTSQYRPARHSTKRHSTRTNPQKDGHMSRDMSVLKAEWQVQREIGVKTWVLLYELLHLRCGADLSSKMPRCPVPGSDIASLSTGHGIANAKDDKGVLYQLRVRHFNLRLVAP
eukprot:2433309-Rhodomonas_salina.1